ncbi:MAG: indolepyruvate ferredoxin oxidoreductase subunit alpha [Desulfobacterales bacterium]|nr:indolepyruvate ferredoxin oxidoreductase subunit alpha [Desulfobacterales bacterium]
MADIAMDKPGATVLLMGNEAVARGAIEAGIGVAAAYPGSPSSEVLTTIASAAKQRNIHAEWSANEKVAMEVAGGASFAGIRSFCSMKQNGANVSADFIVNANMTGIGIAGMVVFISDDPGGLTSNNEEDSRTITKWLDNPLLEPSSAQEAKEMIKWAFEVSEAVNLITFVRGVTRISYTRSNVVLGELPEKKEKKAYFSDLWDMYNPKKSKFTSGPFPIFHKPLHEKLEKAREIFEHSPFNQYVGPEHPELLIITCGACTSYCTEAVDELKAHERVGILKLGTTWPLPEKLVARHLSTTEKVLFVEEMDPFVERSVMELAASLLPSACNLTFYGKRSGHLAPYNEQSTNLVINALVDILDTTYQPRDLTYDSQAKEAGQIVPDRPINMCAGCPHRATFWAVKKALQLDGRKGFVCGDIGCYAMSFAAPGFFQSRTMHAMGSGAGVANGLGNLKQFGFDQPVIAVTGDSTFYHAVLPALVNGVYNNSNFILLILDNSATAMTGFQPHPGTGLLATGDPAEVVDMEAICRAVGAEVEVCDPFDLENTTNTLLNMMRKDSGTRAIIMRHMCQLVKARRKIPNKYKMHVDTETCLGNTCGCDNLCTRVFGCPGLIVDKETGKAAIDEALCVGCGLCADICPAIAIIREEAI